MRLKHLGLIFLLFGALLSVALPLNGHDYNVPLIIDTDMALDDARALVMLLNRDMAEIRLVVTSDGAVSPAAGYKNVKTLFALFPQLKTGHIPVVMGRDLQKDPPPWRRWSTEIFFFHKPGVSLKKGEHIPAPAAIVNALEKNDFPCIYLCLGPLTNLADALEKHPGIKKKISRVIYYGTLPGDSPADWNTARDQASARKVFASGLRVYALSSPGVEPLKFSLEFYKRCSTLNTPASRLMGRLHSHPAVRSLLSEDHFRIWDELAVIFMERPGLFSFDKEGNEIYKIRNYEPSTVYDSYIKLLSHSADSHLQEREVVVLDSFPMKPGDFKRDVRPYIKKIIGKFGVEEWKACVLTNELHRHLGIYSLIGAKMGIRAREILDAPLDSLQVISYAGLRPPLSCVNDGLQVSTGASLGRGTIKVANAEKQPAADFIYEDNKITLRVKDSIVRQIKADIQAAVKKYGGISPEYFAYIRELSLRYWYALDRAEIFEEAPSSGN